MILVFKIVMTVLIGISYLTGLSKNVLIFADNNSLAPVIGWSLWSIAWRTFIIVAIWNI